MDPALLRDREAFKRKALQQSSTGVGDSGPPDKKKKKSKSSNKKVKAAVAAHSAPSFDYRTATSSDSASSFGYLTKIVDYMKKRHLDGNTWGLTLDEILQELLIFDASRQTKEWLVNEALPKNTKLNMDGTGRFTYNPPLKVSSKQSLLSVLKKYDMEAKGGILMSQLADSVAGAEEMVASLGEEVVTFPTNYNKRKDQVIFFIAPSDHGPLLDEFKALWRRVSMEHLDDAKIEEYLKKQGITTLSADGGKKKMAPVPKRKPRKPRNKKVYNEHMEGVLKDFSGGT